MKTRISEIAMALTTLFLCLGLTIVATAQVINQHSEEAMIKSKAMIIEGSRKMIAADKIMNEAKRMVTDGQDPAKARQMMAKASKMMSEAEKIWEQGQEIADRHKQTKERTMPIPESLQERHPRVKDHPGRHDDRAEAILAENSKPLGKGPKMADGSEIHKGH
jgi:hypothetical protein